MKTGRGLLAGAMALAGLMGVHQAQATTIANSVRTEKAADIATKVRAQTKKSMFGGDNPYASHGVFGMTPKEYGMRFGNGGSKKTNRLRYSHNAKVGRRNSK